MKYMAFFMLGGKKKADSAACLKCSLVFLSKYIKHIFFSGYSPTCVLSIGWLEVTGQLINLYNPQRGVNYK
jgi:hypothetical protein